MKKNRHDRPTKYPGFTLIEILIAVVIIGILLAVALPSYKEQMLKTKRSAAKGELMEVLARQEQFFVDNRRYATDLTSLGYAADPYAIDEDGDSIAAGSTERIYLIDLAAGATTTAFTVQAAPQLGQADDGKCGTLSITNLGVKTESGTQTADYCW